jgi:hypothetical protein
MKNKKQRQPVLHRETCRNFKFLNISSIVDRLKRIVITCSVWGWLPLCLGKWILKKDAGSQTSKKVV